MGEMRRRKLLHSSESYNLTGDPMLTATLDAAGEQTAEFIIPRGKAATWSVDETSLANGVVDLLVSYDGRGTWRRAASVATDSSGQIINDKGADISAHFVLRETASSVSGSAVVTLALQPAASITVRDPESNAPLLEYGDEITPLVPLNLANMAEHADNAAALAAGLPVGTVYATGAGALRIVVET
jgi:hypothetical protein